MTRHILDEMIGTPPLSTVDVGGIVRRERRRRVVRWGGVGAVASVVAGAVALAAFAGAPAVTEKAGRGDDGPAATAAAADRFRLLAGTREDAAASAARLSRELDRALAAAAPGARWLRQDLFGRPTGDGQPPDLLAPDSPDQLFSGGTGVSYEGRRGALTVEALSPLPCAADNAKCAEERADPRFAERTRAALMTCVAPTGCEFRAGPKGERILTSSTSSRPPRATAALVRNEARVALADGRVLVLAVDNQFTEPGGDKDQIAQDAPPLAIAHLVAIVATVAAAVLP